MHICECGEWAEACRKAGRSPPCFLCRDLRPNCLHRRGTESCGDRIRTCDLEVMSLASYRTAPPRDTNTQVLARTKCSRAAPGLVATLDRITRNSCCSSENSAATSGLWPPGVVLLQPRGTLVLGPTVATSGPGFMGRSYHVPPNCGGLKHPPFQPRPPLILQRFQHVSRGVAVAALVESPSPILGFLPKQRGAPAR